MPVGTNWTAEEDEVLQHLVMEFGPKRWALIASKMGNKHSKQCRRRWKNFLSLDQKKGVWTPEEDAILMRAHQEHGNKWTDIARMVGGRTDNAVKNRYTALMKKVGRRNHSTVQYQARASSHANQRFAPAPSGGSSGGGGGAGSFPAGSYLGVQRPMFKPDRLHMPSMGMAMSMSDGGHSDHRLRPAASLQAQSSMPQMQTMGSLNHQAAAFAGSIAGVLDRFGQAQAPRGLLLPLATAPSGEPFATIVKGPTGGVHIHVSRNMLSADEMQYARELNAMDIKLHIQLEEDASAAAGNALGGIIGGHGGAEAGRMLKQLGEPGSAHDSASAHQQGGSSNELGVGGVDFHEGHQQLLAKLLNQAQADEADVVEILATFQQHDAAAGQARSAVQTGAEGGAPASAGLGLGMRGMSNDLMQQNNLHHSASLGGADASSMAEHALAVGTLHLQAPSTSGSGSYAMLQYSQAMQLPSLLSNTGPSIILPSASTATAAPPQALHRCWPPKLDTPQPQASGGSTDQTALMSPAQAELALLLDLITSANSGSEEQRPQREQERMAAIAGQPLPISSSGPLAAAPMGGLPSGLVGSPFAAMGVGMHHAMAGGALCHHLGSSGELLRSHLQQHAPGVHQSLNLATRNSANSSSTSSLNQLFGMRSGGQLGM